MFAGVAIFALFGSVVNANSNVVGRPTIFLATPESPDDKYYKQNYNVTVEFLANYAKAIIGKDNVVIFCDDRSCQKLKNEYNIADDILLKRPMVDIWMRDISPAGKMHDQTQFVYAPNYINASDIAAIKTTFIDTLKHYKANNFKQSNLTMDGGSLVDNGFDAGIVTTRLLKDNPSKTKTQIAEQLKQDLGFTRIAIIDEEENDTTGHADGMVMFVDTYTVVIQLGESLSKVRKQIDDQLNQGGQEPQIKIIDVPPSNKTEFFQSNAGGANFTGACGVNINSLVTDDYVYTPLFNVANETAAVINVLKANTNKELVTINVPHDVCVMGGSVRCLSWQNDGEAAELLVEAARKD